MQGVTWVPLDHQGPNGASLLAITEVSAPRCREILHIWALCIDPRRMCRAPVPSNAQCRVKMPRPHTPECVFCIGKKANVLRPHLSSTAPRGGASAKTELHYRWQPPDPHYSQYPVICASVICHVLYNWEDRDRQLPQEPSTNLAIVDRKSVV